MEGRRQRTFIMVKPDGVQRRLVGEVIKRFETKGFKLVALKQLHASEQLLRNHYAEHDGKPFFPKLLSYIGSGPVVAMVWEGANVVDVSRKLVGATRPSESAPGTIRGDFAIEVGRNIIHGSDSVESAQREIALWFRPEEVVEWNDHSNEWIYE
jgi:nucleoside-diphosphate kinase